MASELLEQIRRDGIAIESHRERRATSPRLGSSVVAAIIPYTGCMRETTLMSHGLVLRTIAVICSMILRRWQTCQV